MQLKNALRRRVSAGNLVRDYVYDARKRTEKDKSQKVGHLLHKYLEDGNQLKRTDLFNPTWLFLRPYRMYHKLYSYANLLVILLLRDVGIAY